MNFKEIYCIVPPQEHLWTAASGSRKIYYQDDWQFFLREMILFSLFLRRISKWFRFSTESKKGVSLQMLWDKVSIQKNF